MTAETMRISKLRLRLGITNVGFWVLAAALGLVFLARDATSGLDARRLMMIAGIMLLFQAGFDFLGGQVLVNAPRPSITEFLRAWFRGFLAHTIVILGLALLNLEFFKITGGFCAAALVGMGLLAIGRRQMLRLFARVSWRVAKVDGADCLAVKANEPSFTGGIDGFSAKARILTPEKWLEILPAKELEAELFRRRWQIRNRLPARSLLFLLAWNLSGCTAGKHLLGLAHRAPFEALFGQVCFMTLWGFLALLILPKLSHQAVMAADRAAHDAGLEVRSWIRRFPEWVGEDGSDLHAVQSIFYPIPSAEKRIQNLDKAGTGFVAGNLARNNLYYSLATLTPLGRAVHCNVGHPCLWVFPPSA